MHKTVPQDHTQIDVSCFTDTNKRYMGSPTPGFKVVLPRSRWHPKPLSSNETTWFQSSDHFNNPFLAAETEGARVIAHTSEFKPTTTLLSPNAPFVQPLAPPMKRTWLNDCHDLYPTWEAQSGWKSNSPANSSYPSLGRFSQEMYTLELKQMPHIHSWGLISRSSRLLHRCCQNEPSCHFIRDDNPTVVQLILMIRYELTRKSCAPLILHRIRHFLQEGWPFQLVQCCHRRWILIMFFKTQHPARSRKHLANPFLESLQVPLRATRHQTSKISYQSPQTAGTGYFTTI